MPFLPFSPQRSFSDLSDREVLALAIQNEEEDARIYRDFVERLRDDFPASAKVFEEMAEEENGHRQMLIDLFRERFGEHIPLIRRDDVRGFIRRQPVWMSQTFDIDAMRERAESMEEEAANFYRRAAARTSDAGVRKLLGDLADIEAGHEAHARALTEGIPQQARDEERETARRNFVLRIVQPGLVGLMDGSVSTLAPVFAAAFATHNSWDTFLVGMAASVGAGISMGFAEALSDDGNAVRPRPALAARPGHRADDHGRRRRPHPALSDQRFLDGDDPRHRRGAAGTVGDRLGAGALHGYALPARRLPDRHRRPAGLLHRHIDRQRLTGRDPRKK